MQDLYRFRIAFLFTIYPQGLNLCFKHFAALRAFNSDTTSALWRSHLLTAAGTVKKHILTAAAVCFIIIAAFILFFLRFYEAVFYLKVFFVFFVSLGNIS